MPEPTIFPGRNGIPFRSRGGALPLVKSQDATGHQLVQVNDVHVNVYNLADDTERQASEAAIKRATAANAGISSMESYFDTDTGNWKLLLIWYEIYSESPEESDGNYRHFR